MPPAATHLTWPPDAATTATLQALCAVLLPPNPDVPVEDVAHAVAHALTLTAEPDALRDLALFLRLVQQPWANGLVAGVWQPLRALDRDAQAALLRGWLASRITTMRKPVLGLKRLALFLHTTSPAHASRARHPAPPPPDPTAPPLPYAPTPVRPGDVLQADVLVVGSGAGGGVVAAALAAAGYDVLVVEKGPFVAAPGFGGDEQAATARLFERAGALTTADTHITVLAGSVLGGGTTVNWAASLRPPDALLHTWARDHGFRGAATHAFQDSLDVMAARIGADVPDPLPLTPTNQCLADGLAALGHSTTRAPRGTRGCADCGFCHYGCRTAAKQSSALTTLADAAAHGARIVTDVEVVRLTQSHGQATGAEATLTTPDGAQHPLTMRAGAVVLAAGALHTPAILLRSGLGHHLIGAGLRLHPTSVTFGLFDHAVRGWEGPPLQVVAAHLADLDGRGHGVRLETAPLLPGLAALSLPWHDGAGHAALMDQLPHIANIIAIVRDRDGGRVTLDALGRPRLAYALSAFDALHLRRGLEDALRAHHAAGAHTLGTPHVLPHLWHRGDDFEAFVAALRADPLAPGTVALYSAHQMSSCRIGGSSATGAVDPEGGLYALGGVFVADASVLPTATGVNPMLTILGTAYYLAACIAARLGGPARASALPPHRVAAPGALAATSTP